MHAFFFIIIIGCSSIDSSEDDTLQNEKRRAVFMLDEDSSSTDGEENTQTLRRDIDTQTDFSFLATGKEDGVYVAKESQQPRDVQTCVAIMNSEVNIL